MYINVVVNHAVYNQQDMFYANATNHLQIFMFFFLFCSSLWLFSNYRDDLEFLDQRVILDRKAKRVRLRL